MAQLPERERRLIELRDLQGLAWSEVTRQADEPSLKAAQGCYARARVRLSSALGREQGSD